jgi:hypothetical protein
MPLRFEFGNGAVWTGWFWSRLNPRNGDQVLELVKQQASGNGKVAMTLRQESNFEPDSLNFTLE